MTHSPSRQKLRVLHVTPMYPTAEKPSIGVFVKSQVESLEELVDVDLHVLPGGNGIGPYLRHIGGLRRLLRGDHDLVHVHYGNLASLVKLLGTSGKPVVTSYCGSDLLGRVGWKASLFSRLNRKLAARDDLSIVKSPGLARELEGISPSISIIPNGVDTDRFHPLDREECRRQLGIETGKPVVLFPSNPALRNKNFPLLEQALRAAGAGSHTLVAFDGAKIQHEDMPRYMNAADLVVLTSLHEGSPNVVKEAMACDRPVFATDCGDVRSVLDGVDGSSVISYDEAEWREVICRFLADPAPAPGGREKIFALGLDIRSVAARLASIYEDLASGNLR